MKKILLMLIIFSCSIFAIEQDLYLYENVSEENLEYYQEMDSVFNSYIELATDSNLINKGHLGLAFLQLGLSETNIDSFIMHLSDPIVSFQQNVMNLIMGSMPIFMIHSDEFDSLINDFNFENFNQDSLVGLINELALLFDFEEIEALEENLFLFQENADSIEYSFQTILTKHIENTAIDILTFLYHWDLVLTNSADFEFILSSLSETEVEGKTEFDTTTFIFSRDAFDAIYQFSDHLNKFTVEVEQGFDIMDELAANGEGNVQPAINSFILGVEELNLANITLLNILTEQPFQPLNINVEPLDSINIFLSEIDTLLKGKTYPIGEDKSFVIRPVGLIENLPFGIFSTFPGLYLTNDMESYTFGNIFPNGIPGIEILAYDLVINHEESDIDLFKYFGFKYIEYNLILELNPDNADAHAGIGLMNLIQAIGQTENNISSLLNYFENGRLDSVYYFLNNDGIDYIDDLEEIIYHLEYLAYDENNTIFTTLINDGEYEFYFFPIPGYDDSIQENDDFYPIYIDCNFATLIISTLESIISTIDEIGIVTEEFKATLNTVVDVDLDPEALDFSDCENAIDYIDVLESSNPEFLNVSENGIEMIKDFGEQITYLLLMASNAMDSLIYNSAEFSPYLEEMGVDSMETQMFLYTMNTMIKMLAMDFAIPNQTSYIDGEQVDFSAWFDNPPANFLQMWKNYISGTDSTFGGFFPEGNAVNIPNTNSVNTPADFKLESIYPNPFNPIANIEFNIPKSANVSLSIFNLKGQKIDELFNSPLKAGHFSIQWIATGFPSGIYFCTLKMDNQIRVKKVTLLK